MIALIDPDAFQSIALKWIGVISLVLTAAVAAGTALWQKVSALVDRADRQSVKTGSLQAQVTAVALQTPPTQHPPTNVIK